MVAANKVRPKLKLADLSFWCFVLGAVLLPIGFGGNRWLPFGIAQTAFALASFGVVLDAQRLEPRLFLRLRVAFGLFAVVVMWAWLQTQSFMPVAWLHPLWKEASNVLGRPLHGAIALSPEDSLNGLNRLVTYLAAGILSYLFAQDPKRARQMIGAFWASGVMICLYGLIVYATGLHTILWFDKWAYQDDLTATFVNRNDFAVYAGLVLLCGVALLLQSWKENVQEKNAAARPAALRKWLTVEGLGRTLLLLFVFISLVLSHSRAGFALTLAGLGSYFFFYQVYRQAWGRAVLTLLTAAIIIAAALMIAWQYSDRFAQLFSDYSSADRLKVYKLTLLAIADNPWLGYGLDGFQPVFRLYEQGMIMEFTHAHSDVLESLLDLGIPVGLMLWSAILLLITGLVHGIVHRRRHGIFPCLGLAAAVIVLGHSIVDFSMQIPGVVIPWAMLTGIGLAQSWRQGEKEPAIEWMEY